MIKRTRLGLLGVFLFLFTFSHPALGEQNTFDMSLDEILSIKVMSSTRMPDQSLFDAPSALYVITEEDIRRSGFLHIPDILKLAPALQSARMDAGAWAISARGFNNRYNRLQLVQMDGRSLTNSLFGGVYWANQDYVIEDLDRIEVISGPGGSLWGANAVNGVISIISKPASETQGWLVKTHSGTHERGIGTIRYGGKLGDDSYFRIYAKHAEHGTFDTYTFNDSHYNAPYLYQYTPWKSDDVYSFDDNFRRQQVGFRADWENDEDDSFTLQGDFYRLIQGDSVAYASYTILANPLGTTPYSGASSKESDGWNILGRWNRQISKDASLQLQLYMDWSNQEHLNPLTPFTDKRRVSDIDFQHNFKLGNHNLVWGLEYKRNLTRVDSNIMTFAPWCDTCLDDVLSGFFQDSIPFFSPELELTFGAKIERNDFTGGETQPSVRIAWTLNDDNVLWTSVSKAVKVPGNETMADLVIGGVNVPANSLGAGTPPIDMWMPLKLVGNPDIAEEEVVAYELGYRVKPNDSLYVDLTLYAHRGHHMQRTVMISSTPPTVKLVSSGVVHYEGIELNANWLVKDNWRMVLGYTWFDADEKSTIPINPSGETPRVMAQLRSYHDFGKNLELNWSVYFRDNITHEDLQIPRATTANLGLTWKHPKNNYEISIWGRNLLDSQYRDAGPDRYSTIGAAEVERSFFTQIVWNL